MLKRFIKYYKPHRGLFCLTMAAAVAVSAGIRGGAHMIRVNEVEALAAVARAADRWIEALEDEE